jgi:cation transport regulator ChaC
MDRAAMARRCPGATVLGRAVLNDHAFLISTDGYASVRPASGEVVHGIVWRLAPRDLAALSAYESLASGLYSAAIMTVQCEGRSVKALVYIGRSRSAGKPKRGYMESIVAAARDWRLPPDYIRRLSRWMPAGMGGTRELEPGDIA